MDGDWQEGTYKTDGALFDFIKDYIPVIWGNLRNACEPKIEEEYYIKAVWKTIVMLNTEWCCNNMF